MHSHGNRTPPPQNEPSLNNPVNSGTAASSQTVTSTSSVTPTPTSVSASSTIQTNGSTASSSTTLSTSTTTAPTGNAASQTPSTTNIQASNKPVQPSNANQPKNASQTQGPAQPTKQLKNTKNTALGTTKTGLTHTNAAATPIAKPKTLSALATKDFSNASKTLATFLQRMKSASHTSNNHQPTPANTLPRAAATLPVSQSPVGAKTASPLTREAPAMGPQDEPTVGPQWGYNDPTGHIRGVRFTADGAGNVDITGTADDTDKPFGNDNTWIMARVCPTSTGTPYLSGTWIPSECSDIELYTNGHPNGETGTFSFGPGRWGIFYNAAGSAANTAIDTSHSVTANDFKFGLHTTYNIWLFRRDRMYQHITSPSANLAAYTPTTAISSVVITYNMTDMTGASKPADRTIDTTNGDGSITLAGEPSHPSWQAFDGWYFNYTNYNAGQSVSFAKGTNATYTVTPRWHTRTTKVRFNYNLNGMSGGTPGSQEINTTWFDGSITLQNPPSHPDWQIFDGWTVDGWDNENPGKTYTYSIHDEGTHTVTARWHVRPDKVTINYNANGSGCSMPGQQTADSANYSSTTLAGTPSCPAHTAFDGWTINYNNYAPYGTFYFTQHVTATYTATARTHPVTAPTGLAASYHTTGNTVTLTGTANVQSGDKITACMTEGTGAASCQSSPTAPNANSAWNWTVTFPSTDYTTKYGYGHQHHFTAKLTSKGVDSTQVDLRGSLPWTTVSYDKGDGTGTPPDSTDALTDSAANKTRLTLPGQGSMTAPTHTWFDGWKNSAGTSSWQPGDRTVPIDGAPTDANGHTTLTLTAQWHTVQAPTNLTAAYHITGTVTLSGTADVQSGDKITACMTEGTGDTACQPAITATTNNSAWNWTISFPATDYTTKYGYGHQHHFTAKLTDKSVDSATADLKGTLPWMTVTYNKSDATGTAPHDSDALVDTATGKAPFTIPGQGSMTPPTGAWFEGWKNPDGTLTWQAGTATIPTNASGATTDANGHTTLTLTAQWHTVPAPTGVTARYSHTDNRVYLTAAGLQAGATNWEIQVKPTPTDDFNYASNTSMTGQSQYYSPYFTPGATWTARARATYTDPSGNNVTSDWSTEITGILPYMTVTLDPGQATGDATTIKALIDTGENKAHLTLPSGVGTPPAGMAFQANGGWATNPNGTGNTYNAGDTAIPTTAGTPGGAGETLVTLYAQWRMRTQAPARGQACTSVAGWQQWGTSAGAIPGIDHQDTGAVCWAIEGSTLRLTGGTSPASYNYGDIPWNGQKSAIAKISIEGDLTLTNADGHYGQTFGNMPALTSMSDNNHRVNLDSTGGRYLFQNDSVLTGLDLSSWRTDTATSFSGMFDSCRKLETLTGMENWHTGKVTNLSELASRNPKLKTLDLSGWDTSKTTDMGKMFYGCNSMTDIDLTGWDTSNVNVTDMTWLLPSNVQRLRLGPKAQLKGRAFDQISYGHSDSLWHEWDWPKDHHPSDLGPVGATAGTSGDGTLNTLKARAASATPQGTYIRSDVNPTWTDLKYDLNGGTGDASLFTQPGAAATGSTPKRDGLAIDTTFRNGTYTTANPTHITGNKPHQLFNGWTVNTGNVTGGTATVSNHTITAARGAGGVATITAQWAPVPEALPTNTPQVAVTPRTTDQGSAGVGAAATFNTAMDATTDPARPAIAAGGTMSVCVKPSSQNDDYTPGQCHTKTGTTGGSQTITPDPFALPGSLTGGQATTFPAPGEAYTLAATYTTHDPQTHNQVESNATQNGGGLTIGILPWVNASFDTNDTHGGTGTAPTALQSFVDTASGKAWASLPNATNSMKPGNAVFAGWTTTPTNEQPDQSMGDPNSRNIQLPATTGATETQTTLYAVWHRLATPTVTGFKRDALANTVTITGTSTPWTSEDEIHVEITPLDGQAGFSPGSLNTSISATDGQGHALPYDGHTEHPWEAEIPEYQMPAGGRFRTRTTLEAYDHAWRDTNAGFHAYSATASEQSNLPGHHQHALPLTGGQRTMLIILLALLGVLLTAGSQLARNRRRWHHQ
ncbi:BspA family leucine-rich repeat surface protein [Bifidobacterium sp. ESL0769]|uniref:BspA family leucine-rich repeat surface protein n=1 Tax=Bifidobacterium sp. ESL0769 TaxID=2983229 RepID=UPI0023F80332|nr:BspA family leucine-rich repeat surface protein [Bifidobacterium sp. ESL0769]WEV67437.1 BspA family leucine-rich repeat surface protein [Bifidobacterium sp. ESL0769]